MTGDFILGETETKTKEKSYRWKYYRERALRMALEAILRVISLDGAGLPISYGSLEKAEKALAYIQKYYPKRYPPQTREYWQNIIGKYKKNIENIETQLFRRFLCFSFSGFFFSEPSFKLRNRFFANRGYNVVVIRFSYLL